MKILLTGSGGFIGKNLKKSFEQKFTLLTPRSYELDLTNDVAVKNYFKSNDIDFVIHCGNTGGARGIKDADSTIEDNLAMVENILNNKKTSCKVILFGSGAMYGKTRNLHKVKECEIGQFIPEDLYGKSKLLISNMIKNRDDVLMLNIFGCYGYGEKENRFPSYAISQALKNEDITINQNVVFDYLFIEDAQKIIEYFVEKFPQKNIINITPCESISLLEIANIVKKITKSNADIKILNPILNNEYTGDNSLLLKNIPNFQFTSMEEGLNKLCEYIKNSCNSALAY